MNQARAVLVVDDDPDIRDIVALVLELHGVPCETASDGVQALAALHLRDDIGLVLLDLMMPRMSGLDVLVEMKRDPSLARIPVVVISGNYVTEPQVLGMGANDYLRKPLDVDVLVTTVRRFVSERVATTTAGG